MDGFENGPFELYEQDGNLYGLGVCAMKGSIAAILKAISEIDLDSLDYGIMLIFTYDEEIGFGGIKYFLSMGIEYPEYLLIGEPTDNIVMNGSKGVIAYEFSFNGIRSHSSMPIESSNDKCIMFMNELFRLKEYFGKRWCDEYEYGSTTMNIGIINGGDRMNVVSDYTYATCDFRITKDIEEYEYIKKYVDKFCKKYDVKYKVFLDVLPFYNDSEIVNYYEDITGKKRGKFFGLSEASMLEGNRVILGPGPVTAHEKGEHISIKSLNETVRIYKDIINKICRKKEI